jgi:glutamine amidotransferase
MRVHVPDLRHHPSVVVASEPLDDTAGWRLLESGELVRVGQDLTVRSSIIIDQGPNLIRLGHAMGGRMTGNVRR